MSAEKIEVPCHKLFNSGNKHNILPYKEVYGCIEVIYVTAAAAAVAAASAWNAMSHQGRHQLRRRLSPTTNGGRATALCDVEIAAGVWKSDVVYATGTPAFCKNYITTRNILKFPTCIVLTASIISSCSCRTIRNWYFCLNPTFFLQVHTERISEDFHTEPSQYNFRLDDYHSALYRLCCDIPCTYFL